MGTVQSHTYKASLGTANNSARLNLNASTGYTDISFEDQFGRSNDTTQLTNEVTATYALTRKLTAIGQIGHDSVKVSDDTIYSEDLSGVFYNGGLEYRPSDRLRMTGRYGRRHNTQYYALDGNYNVTKKVFVGATAMTQLLTAVPMGYKGNITAGTLFNSVQEGETLTSAMQEQMNLPGSSQNIQANQAVYANNQNTQMYISRAFNAYLGTQLTRGSAGIALGYETRDYNTAGEETIKTATANYRHDFNTKISATLEGFYYAIDGVTDGLNQSTGDTYGLRLLGNYAFNQSVNLFAAVGRTERSAQRPDAEFTEHNITAGVSTQF
jgi:recombinational DNA repair protein RecR